MTHNEAIAEKGFQKLIAIPITKDATIEEMAELLKQDPTFQDAFPEAEDVQAWLGVCLKNGWITVEDDTLIVWIENH